MNQYDELLGDGRGVLFLLHARFLAFHSSNVFLRDLQYGVREYLLAKGVRIKLEETEKLARTLVRRLEKNKFLRPVDEQTWTLLDPEFKRMTEKVPPVPGPTPKVQAAPAQTAVKPGQAAAGGTPPATTASTTTEPKETS